MMDALARLIPVARPLLRDVDTVLATLGAPGEHAVWRLLGEVGATPADVVESVAELAPGRLRAAVDELSRWARTYGQEQPPPAPAWEGEAARRYAAIATALRAHVDGDQAGLAGRMDATASYVESVAAWQQGARDEMAEALARALTSAEAVTLRAYRDDRPDPTTLAAAAAEIGATLLRVARAAGERGRELARTASGLDELAYRAPVLDGAAAHDGPIRLF